MAALRAWLKSVAATKVTKISAVKDQVICDRVIDNEVMEVETVDLTGTSLTVPEAPSTVYRGKLCRRPGFQRMKLLQVDTFLVICDAYQC
jgi:hypothetical protein